MTSFESGHGHLQPSEGEGQNIDGQQQDVKVQPEVAVQAQNSLAETTTQQHRITRRGLLGIFGGGAVAAGLAAIGVGVATGSEGEQHRVIIPGMSKDGNGSGDNQPLLPPETPTAISTTEATKTPEAGTNYGELRKAADRIGFNMGVWLGHYGFPESYNDLIKIQTSEFNLGALNPNRGLVEAKQGNYNFVSLDKDVDAAIKANMKLYANSLIYGANPNKVPEWFYKGNLTPDQQMNAMKDWITTIMTRYKGKVKAWNVVNEYDTPYGLKDVYLHSIGEKYLEEAYKTARVADPSAILLYNDGDNHSAKGIGLLNNQRYTLNKNVVDRLKSQNLIDGLGMQMHLRGTNPIDKQDLINTMKSYGLPIYITEMDVNMHGVQGTEEERRALQAKIYADVLSAAIESGVCKDFILVGTSDKYSKERVSGGNADAEPLVFDDGFKPKPAFFAMLEVLKSSFKS